MNSKTEVRLSIIPNSELNVDHGFVGMHVVNHIDGAIAFCEKYGILYDDYKNIYDLGSYLALKGHMTLTVVDSYLGLYVPSELNENQTFYLNKLLSNKGRNYIFEIRDLNSNEFDYLYSEKDGLDASLESYKFVRDIIEKKGFKKSNIIMNKVSE